MRMSVCLSSGRVLQLVDSTYSECVCDEERPDIVDCDRGVVTTDVSFLICGSFQGLGQIYCTYKKCLKMGAYKKQWLVSLNLRIKMNLYFICTMYKNRG